MSRGTLIIIAHWLIANVFDTISTWIGLLRGHVEANFLPALILQHSNPLQLFGWKWLWVAWIPLFIFTVRRRWRLWPVLTVGSFLTYAVVIQNFLRIGGVL